MSPAINLSEMASLAGAGHTAVSHVEARTADAVPPSQAALDRLDLLRGGSHRRRLLVVPEGQGRALQLVGELRRVLERALLLLQLLLEPIQARSATNCYISSREIVTPIALALSLNYSLSNVTQQEEQNSKQCKTTADDRRQE